MRPLFEINRLDYDLPEALIAQQPVEPREAGRLLVVGRDWDGLEVCANAVRPSPLPLSQGERGPESAVTPGPSVATETHRPEGRGEQTNLEPAQMPWRDRHIVDLVDELRAGDLLVVNNTKVLPAKFSLVRKTGGRIGGLFVSEVSAGVWEVMLRGAGKLQPKETLAFEGDRANTSLTVEEDLGQGRWRATIWPKLTAAHMLERVGWTPLPPYIERPKFVPAADDPDRKSYQTIFAERAGAVAAPTAGLHFTSSLLEHLERKGVKPTAVTLHVGLGTFSPVTVEDLRDHDMHEEWFEVTQEAAEQILAAKTEGRRVVAVGTTSVRVLESMALQRGRIEPCNGWTKLLIYPPFEFKVVDALLTNFHLPRSTLLALVMAFAGEDRIRAAYAHAVRENYRFFSYGDAMLLQ